MRRVAIQTAALLVDAYRELNAKKLFWAALLISALVPLAFALLGVRDGAFTILGWRTALPVDAFELVGLDLAAIYKTLFLGFGVKFWLAWAATILALVTTSGMLPDFLASGSVDLALSKPISRARLYLTKFAGGLLFTAAQVTLFTTASFLVIGLRGGEWIPALFLAVPLVTLFYSYLYAICALFGLLTRSTIAALLLTILVWFSIFIFNTADKALLGVESMTEARLASYEEGLSRIEQRIANAQGQGDEGALAQVRDAAQLPALERIRDRLQRDLEETKRDLASMRRWSSRINAVRTVLPKTDETIELLRRWLERYAGLPSFDQVSDQGVASTKVYQEGETRIAVRTPLGVSAKRVREQLDARRVSWIIGTSLLFEAVLLGLGCFVFSRRDY